MNNAEIIDYFFMELSHELEKPIIDYKGVIVPNQIDDSLYSEFRSKAVNDCHSPNELEEKLNLICETFIAKIEEETSLLVQDDFVFIVQKLKAFRENLIEPVTNNKFIEAYFFPNAVFRHTGSTYDEIWNIQTIISEKGTEYKKVKELKPFFDVIDKIISFTVKKVKFVQSKNKFPEQKKSYHLPFSDEAIKKGKAYLAEDKVQDFFKLLEKELIQVTPLGNELLLLKNRWVRLKREISSGTLTPSEKNIETNKLLRDLLNFLESDQ